MFLSVFCLFSHAQFSQELESHARDIYSRTGLRESEVPFDHFFSGYQRFLRGKQEGTFSKALITYVNFSLPSNVPRLFSVDISNSNASLIYKEYVAHGVGSGSRAGDKLNPSRFTNGDGDKTSSLGFFKAGERGVGGKVGPYVAVDGLSGSQFNSEARDREILIHSGSYVGASFAQKWGVLGESWGCFAIPEYKLDEVLSQFSGGTLLYAFQEEVFNPEVQGDLMGIASSNNESAGSRINTSDAPAFESVSERLGSPSPNTGGTDGMKMTGIEDNEAENFDDASEPEDFEEDDPQVNSSGSSEYAGNEGYENCQKYADRSWDKVVEGVQGGANADQYFEGSWKSLEDLYFQTGDNVTNTALVSEAREHFAKIRECAALASINNSTNFTMPAPNNFEEIKSDDGSISCRYLGSESVDYQKCVEMISAHNDLLNAEEELHSHQSDNLNNQGSVALNNLKNNSGQSLQSDSLTAAANLTNTASLAAAARIDFQKQRASILIDKLEQMPNHSSLMSDCNEYYNSNQDIGVKGYQAFVANIKFADTSVPSLKNPCPGAINRTGIKFIQNKKAKDQVKDYLNKIGVKIEGLESKRSNLNDQVQSIQSQNQDFKNKVSMGGSLDFSVQDSTEVPESEKGAEGSSFGVSTRTSGGFGAMKSGNGKNSQGNDSSSFSSALLQRNSRNKNAARSLNIKEQTQYKEQSNLSKFFNILKSNNPFLINSFISKYGINSADLKLALQRGVISQVQYKELLNSLQGRLPASSTNSAWLQNKTPKSGNNEWQIEKNKNKNLFQIISHRYNKKSGELLQK